MFHHFWRTRHAGTVSRKRGAVAAAGTEAVEAPAIGLMEAPARLLAVRTSAGSINRGLRRRHLLVSEAPRCVISAADGAPGRCRALTS